MPAEYIAVEGFRTLHVGTGDREALEGAVQRSLGCGAWDGKGEVEGAG